MRTAVTLGFGSFTVAVECEVSEHLEWLVEFLEPHFQILSDAEPTCHVLLRCDSRRFSRLAELDLRDSDIPVFINDRCVVRMPFLNQSGQRIVVDQKQGVFYSARREAKEIEIVAPGTGVEGREPLMKVVRELAMSLVRAESALVLHASACSIDNEGIVIAGAKRSGKTSLLSYALMAADAVYVSNDRVAIRSSDAGPQVHGIPTIVTVRSSVFEFLPELRERLLASGFQSKRTMAEAAANLPTPRPGRSGRYGLSPPQFCSLAGAGAVSSCPASVVLFPQIGALPGAMQLVPLGVAEGGRRLAESIFGGLHRRVPSGLFELKASPPSCSEVLIQRCAALARQVPCYEVKLGPHSYDDRESARVLTRALVGGRLTRPLKI